MDGFWMSTLVVALGEIGDKTQVLALVLATRYRKPAPIILAIALSTFVNHTIAAWAGAWVALLLSPTSLRDAVVASFVVLALWSLRTSSNVSTPRETRGAGVFLVTLGSFFLAETGDKTQIATVILAARYSLLPVVLGSTLGLLLVDVPVVLLGPRAVSRIPGRWMRAITAIMFVVMAALAAIAVRS